MGTPTWGRKMDSYGKTDKFGCSFGRSKMNVFGLCKKNFDAVCIRFVPVSGAFERYFESVLNGFEGALRDGTW
jgi:hypothetical protein